MTDLAPGLWRHAYQAVSRARQRAGGRDDFTTSMLGRRTVVLRSEAGVRCFYDPALVAREGATPGALRNLLFGKGAVHGLDGPAHRERKDLLRSLLEDAAWRDLVDDVATDLEGRATGRADGAAGVHGALVAAYGEAALRWAGLRPTRRERHWVPPELARIVAGFGGRWPEYPRAWVARWRTDRWLRARVDAVRGQRREAADESPLGVLAASGLPTPVAAVELGNLVRPTVAVAWLGTSAALHLDRFPEWGRRLATATVGRDHLAFAQEVRRATPFVPVLAGIARRATRIGPVEVAEGDRLLLDVWGVDQDPRRWPQPQTFDPRRFVDRSPDAFELVPQGGGPVTGHRCPGETLTLALLCETVRVLAAARYGRRVEPRPQG